MQATSAGLDVQLKILQALPSLVQNYASDLKGNLLVTTLNICFTLQSSKNAIVNHTSAATLQQLVVSVFDKVVAEDSESCYEISEERSDLKQKKQVKGLETVIPNIRKTILQLPTPIEYVLPCL